jgi:hypothetical protein
VLWAIQGRWLAGHAGIGAGSDSFYEYLLKSYILFGEPSYLHMYNKVRWLHIYELISMWSDDVMFNGCVVVVRCHQEVHEAGRLVSRRAHGHRYVFFSFALPTPTVLITVGVWALWWPGSVAGSGVDSLQAFFPGVQVRFDSQRRAPRRRLRDDSLESSPKQSHLGQVLNGDVSDAVEMHSTFYSLWKRYGSLPESFNIKQGPSPFTESSTALHCTALTIENVQRCFYCLTIVQDNHRAICTEGTRSGLNSSRAPSCSTMPRATRSTLR